MAKQLRSSAATQDQNEPVICALPYIYPGASQVTSHKVNNCHRSRRAPLNGAACHGLDEIGQILFLKLRRPRPQPKVLAFIAAQALELLYISTVTLAEVRFGMELVPDPSRRSDLIDRLTHEVRPMFEGRVLSIGEDAPFKWRLMAEEGHKTGQTFSQPDLLPA
jgi:predicted nucleic acid-binding protein